MLDRVNRNFELQILERNMAFDVLKGLFEIYRRGITAKYFYDTVWRRLLERIASAFQRLLATGQQSYCKIALRRENSSDSGTLMNQ